jgi:hypothetical protein
MRAFMSSFTAGNMAESAEIFEITVIFTTLNVSARQFSRSKGIVAGTSVWIEQS